MRAKTAAALILSLCGLAAAHRPEPALREPRGPAPAELRVGYYRCRGEGPGGQPYAGLAAVRRIGRTCAIEYYGGAGLVAAGVLQGDTLAIGFGQGRTVGVAVYRVLPGRLEGITAQLPTQDGAHGKETLTWFAPFEEGEDGPGE
jgi:hypothetical protein